MDFRGIAQRVFSFAQIFSAMNTVLSVLFGSTIVAAAGSIGLYVFGLLHVSFEALVIYVLGFLLAAAIVLLIGVWRRFEIFKSRLTRMVDRASNLSNSNADCDKQLFDSLFVQPFRNDVSGTSPSIRPVLLPAIPSAKIIVTNNVQQVLDQAHRIFTILTGETSYFTIKIIVKENDEYWLKTARRDAACHDMRKARDKKKEPLRNNRQMEEIVRGLRTNFACDNLKREKAANRYDNSREDWADFYNATLVVPIAGLQDDEINSILLCVDNFRGGLNNKLAVSIANYLANRLSIMLHRASVFDEFIGGTSR